MQAAEAALRVARADLNAAMANRDLASSELARARQLTERQIASEAALDRAKQTYRVSEATVETAEAAISMREADLANARAQLIGFDDQGLAAAIGGPRGDDIPLHAPTDGRILRVMQQSETTLPAGAPIMEIGDIAGDLEVTVDLISSDAVQVTPGSRVIIADWGGETPLAGEVRRIDPLGVTKFSALGVEEQRVAVTVALTGDPSERAALGHGYRVEAQIVVWQQDDALRVPSSALFRSGDAWAVFVDAGGTAALRPVEIGRNNGIVAEVLDGLGGRRQRGALPVHRGRRHDRHRAPGGELSRARPDGRITAGRSSPRSVSAALAACTQSITPLSRRVETPRAARGVTAA